MNRIISIQYLRGFAALAVVIFHEFDSLNAFSVTNIDRMTGRLHVLGTAGVDIFFVISGFIMVVLLARTGEAQSRALFAQRRIIRIVPTYWLLTLVMFAVRLAETRYAASPDWGWLLGSVFFVPMRDAAGMIYPLLSPGWTLSFEMFFYLLLFAFVGLPVRIVTGVVVGLFAGLVAGGLAVGASSPALLFLTSPLLLEFALGMLIGMAFIGGAATRARWGALCIAACVLIIGLTHAAFIRSDIERLLIRGVPAALLVLGMLCFEERLRRAPWRPLLILGDASYALYLTHDFVLPAVNRVAAGRLGLPLALVAWLAVAASLAVGWGFFVAVERPMIRWLSQRFGRADQPQRKPAMALAEPASLARPPH
jgi:exopolysaccharide production protein ExoZ